LADAQRSLKEKETKRAREEERIATSKIDNYVDRLADLKRTEARPNDSRIFPLYYAPVVVNDHERLLIRPMRYTCRLAGKPANYDRRYPGTYNARRDNLSGFWSEFTANITASWSSTVFSKTYPLICMKSASSPPASPNRMWSCTSNRPQPSP
jgi:hypothetical protein